MDRKVQIKSGAVRRLSMELKAYLQERQQLEQKINNLPRNDVYAVKKHKEMLQETNTVLQDTIEQLRSYVAQLQACSEGQQDETAEKLINEALELIGGSVQQAV